MRKPDPQPLRAGIAELHTSNYSIAANVFSLFLIWSPSLQVGRTSFWAKSVGCGTIKAQGRQLLRRVARREVLGSCEKRLYFLVFHVSLFFKLKSEFFFSLFKSPPQPQHIKISLQTEFIKAQQTPPPCECIRYNVGWSNDRNRLNLKFKD